MDIDIAHIAQCWHIYLTKLFGPYAHLRAGQYTGSLRITFVYRYFRGPSSLLSLFLAAAWTSLPPSGRPPYEVCSSLLPQDRE
jgi:hypothetical protein